MEVAGSGRCTKTDGAIDGVSVDSMSGFGFAMVERDLGQEPGRKSSNRKKKQSRLFSSWQVLLEKEILTCLIYSVTKGGKHWSS